MAGTISGSPTLERCGDGRYENRPAFSGSGPAGSIGSKSASVWKNNLEDIGSRSVVWPKKLSSEYRGEFDLRAGVNGG